MEMIINLSTLFSSNLQQILLKAFVVGLLTAVCAAVLGVPLVLKRYSMIGDGLSHMGFCALAIAAALGVAPENTMYITMPFTVIAAIVLLLLSESGKIKGDAVIAMLSTGTVAAGYMIYCLAGKDAAEVCSSLFGSAILALDGSDVTLSVVLAVGVLLVFILLFRKIFAITFDAAFAKAAGTNVTLYNLLLAVLTAVTIVVGMKMIGSIMISSLVVFPALTAMRICKNFKGVILLSALISALCFTLGLLFAATVELRFGAGEPVSFPVGPCVVAFNVLSFLVTLIFKKIKEMRKAKKAIG
jgi:zinc transport system permease protein